MSDLIATKTTSLASDDLIARSVQFFTTGAWRTQSQSARIATFAGRPPIPIGLIILTVLGFLACIVPGIICYILLIKKVIQLQNIVVTTTPIPSGGSEVVVKYSAAAQQLVTDFLKALPA